MDKNKKLSEELLKIDGIDPANITETERAIFKAMLDKHFNSGQSKPDLWRIIMKSPIIKISVAAVFIIVCFAGLHFWKSTGSGIALADVLTRIEQVSSYEYQISSKDTRQQTTTESTSTLLISQENGIKITSKTVDPNNGDIKGHDSYLLPLSNSLIYVDHKEKTYDRFIYDGQELEFYKEEYNEPHTIIKQILSCDHKNLGQSIIDGITVEGFQTTDLAYEGGFFGEDDYFVGEYKQVNVKLWVNVNTFLPVRLEEDIVMKNGRRINQICYDFRWNVIINPDDFEPNIPEDYRAPAGDIIIPAFNEEIAIMGLKLWADAFGKYPVNLETSLQEYGTLSVFDPNSYEDMSDEERTSETSELIQMAAPSIFYELLVEESKEPVYFGETVGADDADKVLMRWKLDDAQYRVIFGDLSVKTVTAEELAELEKQ